MTHNRLRDETSPYLRQHADNPVHWFAWGDDAFAAAKAENKPILLSVGYAACHWCHVMAHESFEDPDIAARMNDLFVNVKVDREERPDVDSIYQTALQLIGEHGGWPLTMFLTPNGDPFWGGTYFPNTPKYGRPGFPQILQSVSDTYVRNPQGIQDNVTAVQKGLTEALAPKGGGSLSSDTVDQVAALAVRHVDPYRGGTAGAPKFPQPMFFRFLWHAYLRSGGAMFKDAVTLTLDNICQGGIYDHLGGGFARYSTDDRWLAPHFEKMLYDNGLLLELMSDVWLTTRSPLYAHRTEETIDWLLREMTAEADSDGRFAFASALDADSEGEEGKFYVWSEAEIAAVLGGDAARFAGVYDVSEAGNWEGHNILNRLDTLAWDDALDAEMAPLRQKLFDARAPRIRPGRDDKVLADWNGLVIAGIARAGVAFGRPDWTDLACSVYGWIKAHMIAEDGRLRHSMCDGKRQHPAVLDDYANVARAAIILFETTGDAGYLADAEAFAETVEAHYADADTGGYFMAAHDTDDLVAKPKPIMDNATPAGNGTFTEVLVRLHLMTGKDIYRERAERQFTTFAAEDAQNNLHHPTLMIAWDLLSRGTQVVIVGAPSDAAASELANAALTAADRLSVVTRVDPAAPLPDGHAAAGKSLVDGAAAAYVCVGQTCGLPITAADTLRKTLTADAA